MGMNLLGEERPAHIPENSAEPKGDTQPSNREAAAMNARRSASPVEQEKVTNPQPESKPQSGSGMGWGSWVLIIGCALAAVGAAIYFFLASSKDTKQGEPP